ncbi:hypothetical protein [Rathayibacter sp. VKM Ac-2927]|nr:hypothetical protein [Rathayibacter sp. VKM Ac-2927]
MTGTTADGTTTTTSTTTTTTTTTTRTAPGAARGHRPPTSRDRT